MNALRAFTLTELVVVLLILALTAHLAVRGLSSATDARRTEAADRQLNAVRAAVYVHAPGDDAPTGFLADMGRLPRLAPLRADETAPTNATLSELWRRPDGARPFALRPATPENLAPGADTNLARAAVFVPTGWRGPYLALPTGRTRLTDPWGNPMELEDAAGLPRLVATNGDIVAVRHYGARAQEPDAREVSLLPDGATNATARLVVALETLDADGAQVECRTNVCLYAPQDGWIAVREEVTAGGVAVFESVTPGVRVLRVGEDFIHPVVVRPGGDLVRMRIRKTRTQ